MSYSRRSRYSHSPSPHKHSSRSISRSPSRSRSRSIDSSDAENPGNNLYVTGLSTRVSRRDLEKHFSSEGKVEEVRLVVDPRTQESRGFGFVTMSTVEEADRCVKYLDRSVLEDRVITVEKARRRRGRTPTPGRYLGLRTVPAHRRSPSYSPYSRSVSPSYSSERDRGHSRSYSPYYSRRRQSYSSYPRQRSYSPYYRHGRYRSRSRSRSLSYRDSPVRRRDRSYSPCYSLNERYYRRRYRSSSQSYSPYDSGYRRSRYRSWSRSPSRSRSHSRSISPMHRRNGRRYSPRRLRRSYSRSLSPKYYRKGSYSRSVSPATDKRKISGDSRSSRSHSRSPSVETTSRSG